MSRSDQVKRQWMLLQKLEAPPGATLDELCRALPSDLDRHPRTIRRDLAALEAVFPLLTDRVEGQTRWRFVEGYRRSLPLALSPTELMALVFSQDLMRPLDGTAIKASLDAALDKARAMLSPDGLTYVTQLRSTLAVAIGPHNSYREHRDTIDEISRAIARKRTVQMRYFSASQDRTTRRDLDPYRLWYADGGLYVIGYCHRRKDVRMFAVDRIRALTTTNRPCQLPLGFDFNAYVQETLVVMRGKPIDVELLFDRATAAWARDRQWHQSQKNVVQKDGRLLMSLRLADTRELVGWILSFGGGVQVLSPDALRGKVRDEARRILESA